MKYEYLEHTADIKFRAYGNDLNEVFENAAMAFFDSITNTKKVKPTIKKVIKIKAEDLKSLMYDFLEELLFIHETDKYLFSKFNVEIKDLSLTATLYGEKISKKHELKNLVKAVTYNDMIVTDTMAQVVIDI